MLFMPTMARAHLVLVPRRHDLDAVLSLPESSAPCRRCAASVSLRSVAAVRSNV